MICHSFPFRQDKGIAFNNVTFDGSRLILNQYNFKSPAEPEFCATPFPEPMTMMNAPPGIECGVNGKQFQRFENYLWGTMIHQ